MSSAQLDHIVITAPSLALGIDYVHRTLGVAPQKGGEHPRWGTHNYFLKLGEKIFLEVISVNPAAPAPRRPRWFALDPVGPNEAPRLATWVLRTDDIEAAALASPVPLGRVERVTRGHVYFDMTIREDGSLPCDGIAPMLIQWPPDTHPTTTLEDLGCSLVRLEAFHPDAEQVSGLLKAVGFDGEVLLRPLCRGGRPYLVAHIRSPAGLCRLGPAAG